MITPNKGLRHAMDSFLRALDQDDNAHLQLWGETIATVCKQKQINVVELWKGYFAQKQA